MVEALTRGWPKALPFCAAGLLLGLAYFMALRLSLRLLLATRRPLIATALTLLRLAVIGSLMLFAARRGAVPLLSALAGLLVARTVAVGRCGRWAVLGQRS